MPALAKLTRPKTHRALQRERLFGRLDESRQRPLVWVTSPPGAGKTTLVSSYIEQRKLRSLWYHLDPGDDDIGTFFYYLSQALPAKKPELPQFLPAHRADLPAFCRHFFRALFTRTAAPSLIVLDNYHELADTSPLHGLMEPLIAEVPDEHSIVVISRGEPPRALSRLRMNGMVATVDWSLLRMSLDETRAMAEAQSMRDERAIARLHAQADGWAAGLALSVQRIGTAGAAPAAMSEANEAVFDYFAMQLLRQASPELQHFLLRTSLLPTLTAESANAMSGRDDGAEVLEDLHRRGLFTNRRNTRPPSYQYHDLFRGFLATQLASQVPAPELRALQRRAGGLLEAAGHSDHAIRLYLDVGDWDDARRALLASAPELLAQGRAESLRDWIRALPETHASSPWLLYFLGAALARLAPPLARAPLAAAWKSLEPDAELELRRLICADMILTYALEYADFTPLDQWGGALLELLDRNHPFQLVPAELHVHSGCLFALAQRLPRPVALERSVRRVLQLVDDPAVPPDLAALSLGFVLVLHFSTGDLGAGYDVARRLLDRVQRPGLSPMAAAMSRIQLGHYELRKGEPEKARAELSQGLAIAQANALNLPMLRVFSNLGMAFASLQQRDLAQADRHRQAMEEASAPERLTDRVALLRIHAWMACQRGQWELAFTLAEQHLAMARQCALFVVMFECHILVAYLCAQTGRVARMEEQLAEIEQLIAGTAFEKLRYQCHLARAYRALLAGESAECHRLLELGLSGSTTDEGKFMLRMQPLVLPRLLAEALRAGIQRGYVLQLIASMRVPAPPEAGEDWPWPIRVYTLGRFEVQLQGQPLEFSRKAPKKTLALLKAIIALGGTNVREQRLLDTFWPDEEGDTAARSLTAALHRLRGLLGDPDAVIQQGGVLSLDASRVWVDALALDAGLSGETRISAAALLQLYRGSFLREDEGEPWSVTTRERLRSRFIHALSAETAQLEQAGKYALAIECYLRGIDADAVIEPFYQGLMRCYARDGRRSEAVATYRRLRHILSVTLALKPSASTERLYQELRLD